jgi:hypothetical protein
MVFQDLDDPPVGATFGEVMCSVYQAYGSVGLVTSGGGRDLLQVEALDVFPVRKHRIPIQSMGVNQVDASKSRKYWHQCRNMKCFRHRGQIDDIFACPMIMKAHIIAGSSGIIRSDQ